MTMREWLMLYGESHQHPINIVIHKVCVPVIVFTVLGLLWCVPLPPAWRTLLVFNGVGYANLATLAVLLGLVFYSRLSTPITIGMAMLTFTMLLILGLMEKHAVDLLTLSMAAFAIAWVCQFIGHKIEGQQPSFFRDLQFLLIGPAWTLVPLYRRLGISY
ncbi:DUF962 domain-containing protein [Crenobacter sp. SG2303]|uniref:DUF962 domain-containing protein n=1 Tax=Crenobacter oryzisoli TaxID=3056844 RepID=A0ABT7XIS7_9NEIS|nr:Mpo1-like protein [Crenobacter sp. SG2303]MDN0073699.1 DUF962 domain-containing protein [Crenobacter sp. SG2303]